MAKKFTFDDAITTDIKGAASNSYIDNIKMIKIADIETNAENFYSLPDIEDLAEDIDRQGLIHSLAVAKISSEKYGNTYHILGYQAKPTLLQFCLMTTDARENDSWASKVLLIRIKLKSCFK